MLTVGCVTQDHIMKDCRKERKTMEVYSFHIEKRTELVKGERKYIKTVTFDTVWGNTVSVNPASICKIYPFSVINVDEVIWDGNKSSADCPYCIAQLIDGSVYAIHVGDMWEIRIKYFGEEIH